MRRTRKRQKENAAENKTETVSKRSKSNTSEVEAVEVSDTHVSSAYFKKEGKKPLKNVQNEDCTVKGEKKVSRKSAASKQCVSDKEDRHTNVKDTVTQPLHTYANINNNKNDTFTSELLHRGLKTANSKYSINVYKPVACRSRNMLHYLEQLTMGVRGRLELQKSIQSPLSDLYSDLQVYRHASPFDRRVTALEWHPTKPNILAIGSKGGDVFIWDIETFGNEKHYIGIGAAGSCQAMKFWPWDTEKIVTASINGTVTLHDLNLKKEYILANTMDSYDHWYCSLDINASRNMVAAGRNLGILHLMSREGRKIFEFKLHKNKITHVEFSPREEWLLCTASTDQTVQLWDIRQMKDRKSSLHTLKHNKPVNSAYFSQTDGCRLLTTDQGTEIRVYQSPSWHLETTISHPHRFFQHITPFKATWHPLQDLIVCGRYPDKNFPVSDGSDLRSIDLFDGDTGKLLYQLTSPAMSGLCSLNKFSPQGDSLVSGMGFHTLFWNRKEHWEKKRQDLNNKISDSFQNSDNSTSNRSTGSRSRPRPRPRGKKGEENIDDLKKKKSSKTLEERDYTSSQLKSKQKKPKKEK